ncbi:MAG: hypothetical protein K2W82_17290 [Candidatus Obscuribacterales bacterium]|nr:hypothetical protein [Candidatus Obscuribacterales bacterium]
MVTPTSLLFWIFCLWLVCCVLSAIFDWETVGLHCFVVLFGGIAGSIVSAVLVELALFCNGSVSGSCNQLAIEGALAGAFVGFVLISLATIRKNWRQLP